ncbi:MAG: sigma D regulator [Gammaproteobacteria bacterium]|jgi:regulator of sigma D|uniref:sigma D regulator n=1 Tax=Marinomonas TaxID=28253 RepID=UPI000C1E98D8|nr:MULTISPECIES: sigma D regulator [unclassified Marinomonas]MBU1296409.1 sigma D regulator [Gammaproteobacteria bacterium]MBU1464824.1 sigma D regulator [Gammaproteobacteria bacterium]MBU2021883.1 sigma D regulator [Gammaproteobacteria bacterium]MBU2237492.1 sigma D regulator [Gammaproteobacteria bacterium]MBU2318705.1 sigma D regulator [Gammaproteobacteria bacterium]|tara:strand:- start:19162 stop:19632 length:471 start_codon:yes stop_codon:yes gene_type:complete
MLEGCKTAQERWGGVHIIIDRWLGQRRQLLEMGIYLRERGEFTPTDTPKIQSFCEQLVDYVSAGHFTVYEQLALEAKEFHDDGAVILLRELLPLIDSTTEVAIEFNDKYDTKEHCNAQLEALPFSLQALAVVMAERFQYEDQLIKELHEAHSEKSV